LYFIIFIFFYRKFVEKIKYTKNLEYLSDKTSLINKRSEPIENLNTIKLTNSRIKTNIKDIKEFIKEWDNFKIEKYGDDYGLQKS